MINVKYNNKSITLSENGRYIYIPIEEWNGVEYRARKQMEEKRDNRIQKQKHPKKTLSLRFENVGNKNAMGG